MTAALPLGLALALAAILHAGRDGGVPLPGVLRRRAVAAIAAAGEGPRRTPESLIQRAALCGLAGGAIGVIATWGSPAVIVVAPLLAAAGAEGPFRLLAVRATRRRERILRELPDLLDLLAICVGNGMALDPALRLATSRFPGVVGDEFATLFAHLDLGARRADAYRDLGRRLGTSEARALAAALIQADELGLPLAPTLAEQAEALRSAREQLVRTRAEKAAPRVQLVVALVMVPGAMILILGALVLELIDQLGSLGVTG